jgi:hypothetical protein
VSPVSLIEVEPELEPLLAGEQLDHARGFTLAARTMEPGADVIDALEDTKAFGAVLLDGLLLNSMQIGKRPALRLIEPGDVLPFARNAVTVSVAVVKLRAATRSRIVQLDDRFLLAAQRWPQLAALTHRRAVATSERLATQFAISHLSRVDERLMSMMWLLAESWGHVTSSGIRLRLVLSHDTLGELVGAQRPTVSIALKELAKRGSLIRQDEGWLILDPPPEQQAGELERPRLIVAPHQGPFAEPEERNGRLELLQAELARLRHKYAPHRAQAHDLADQARQIRARTHELVERAHALGLVTDGASQRRAS